MNRNISLVILFICLFVLAINPLEAEIETAKIRNNQRQSDKSTASAASLGAVLSEIADKVPVCNRRLPELGQESLVIIKSYLHMRLNETPLAPLIAKALKNIFDDLPRVSPLNSFFRN